MADGDTQTLDKDFAGYVWPVRGGRVGSLIATKTGTGSGTVTSSPAGIDCGTDCEQAYPSDYEITLTVSPDSGSTFVGWSGDCSSCGTATTCMVDLTTNTDRICTAVFTVGQYFIVNTTDDEDDADPYDGRCDVDLDSPGDQCTLRAAISEANRRQGKKTIFFNISGSDIPVIKPKSPLPAVTHPTVLDAVTFQSGGKVIIDGADAGFNTNGLHFQSGDNLVKGVVVRNFQGHGILSDGYYISDNTYPLRLDGVEVTKNGKWGVYTKGELDINTDSTGAKTFVKSKFSENGWGGIRSTSSYINGFLLEVSDNLGAGIVALDTVDLMAVQVNRNRGPGIKSFWGNVHIKARGGFDDNEVIGNKGDGIYAGIPGSDEDATNVGVGIYQSIQVKDNSGWGIYSGCSIVVNRTEVGGIDTGDKRTSYITGNGVNEECWIIEDNDEETSRRLTQGRCPSGGMRARHLDINAAYVDVYDNRGPGIVANRYIKLTGTNTVNGNWGPGIQSFIGDIELSRTGEGGTCTIKDNKGHGIWADKGVVATATLDIEGNAGFGVYSRKGVISINTHEGKPISSTVSYIKDNGTGSICYVIEDNDWDIPLSASRFECLAGGIYADRGSVTASKIEITENNGPGVYAYNDLTLLGNKVCNNDGGNLSLKTGTLTLLDITFCDLDTDGISDEIEAQAPNNGDGNLDGILDKDQANVASFITKGLYTTIAGDSTMALSSVTSGGDTNAQKALFGPSLPVGLINFTVSPSTKEGQMRPQSASFVVTLYIHKDTPIDSFWMFGRTKDNPTPHWYRFDYDGTTGAEIQNNKVILHLVDGERGDDDLTVNNKITLNGGPGWQGSGPGIAVNPVYHDFGTVFFDTTSEPIIFTVKSVGSASLTIGSLSTTESFSLYNDSCSGQTLSSGSTCTFGIVFTPSVGEISGKVSIPFSGSENPVTIVLSGISGPYVLSLSKGWNFISIPIEPVDKSIIHVLGPVLSSVRVVWGYDNEKKAWLIWKPTETRLTKSFERLTTIESGKGYWIYMDEEKKLSLQGRMGLSKVTLFEGWNLIGYSSLKKNIPESLMALSEKWLVVWSWQDGGWKVKSTLEGLFPNTPELDTFNRGKAYWIRMKNLVGNVEWQQ